MSDFDPSQLKIDPHAKLCGNCHLAEKQQYESSPHAGAKKAKTPNCNTCHGPIQEMNITAKGNSFQMAWCLQCHRAPQKYLWKDESNPNQTPRQQVFNLYRKLQENGRNGMNSRELSLLKGDDPISLSGPDVEKGQQLVKDYGVKVQQLADCWVCHR